MSTDDDSFNFRVDRVKTQFSRDDMISSLRQFADNSKTSSLGMRDYNAWDRRLCNADTIARSFGTWGKALQAAGHRVFRGQLDPKEMVKAFKACWREKRSVPRRKEFEFWLSAHNFPFRYKSYLNFYGGIGPLARLIEQVEAGSLPESVLFRRRVAAKPSRALPAKLRYAVLARDGGRCVLCGADPKTDPSVKLHVDHIVPHASGGPAKLENLQTYCSDCNLGKSDS